MVTLRLVLGSRCAVLCCATVSDVALQGFTMLPMNRNEVILLVETSELYVFCISWCIEFSNRVAFCWSQCTGQGLVQ